MSLADLIRRNASGSVATAIPAIRATDEGEEGATVAGIATVAVASPSSAETVQPDDEAGGHVARIARARSVENSHVDPEYDGSQHAEPADEGAEAGLPDPAAELHTARLHRFLALGLMADRAEAAADRLARRDVDYGDDRRMCIECSHLGTRGRCIAAQRGRLIGAVRDLQPIPDLLQRCEAFGLRKGLTRTPPDAGAQGAGAMPRHP